MRALVKRFFKDEQGLELSEYAVMVGLLLVIALAVILLVGNNINRIFGLLNTQLDTVTGP
jgi:pilus assembly protein Flp/PilA